MLTEEMKHDIEQEVRVLVRQALADIVEELLRSYTSVDIQLVSSRTFVLDMYDFKKKALDRFEKIESAMATKDDLARLRAETHEIRESMATKDDLAKLRAETHEMGKSIVSSLKEYMEAKLRVETHEIRESMATKDDLAKLRAETQEMGQSIVSSLKEYMEAKFNEQKS